MKSSRGPLFLLMPSVSRLTQKETICRGQMLLNEFCQRSAAEEKICRQIFLRETLREAGKGGPAARPYGVRVGEPRRQGVSVFIESSVSGPESPMALVHGLYFSA